MGERNFSLSAIYRSISNFTAYVKGKSPSVSIIKAGRTFSPFGFGQGYTIFSKPETFHATGKRFLDKLQHRSSDANLVVIFGSPRISFFPEEMFPKFVQPQNPEDLSNDSYKPCSHSILNKILYITNYFRTNLPKNCHLVYVATSIMGKKRLHFEFFHATAIIFQPMSDVEIQQFVFPSDTIDQRRISEIHHVPIMDDAKAVDVKCILMFTDNYNEGRKINEDLFKNSSICNPEKTVVIGGRLRYQSGFTGLSFNGNNVRIECAYLREKECCAKNQLKHLKRMNFQKEVGIAFLLSPPLVDSIVSVFKRFKRSFPNIILLGIPCEEIFCRNVVARRFLEKCDKCHLELDMFNCKNSNSQIILFILFRDGKCKLKYNVFS